MIRVLFVSLLVFTAAHHVIGQDRMEKRKAAIAEKAKKIKPSKVVPTMPNQAPAVGLKGRLNYPMRVLQVIDGQNMIVETIFQWEVRRDGKRPTEPTLTTVWITGYSTAGLADNATVEPSVGFEITDTTKKYANAAGVGRTVFLLQPMTDTTKKEEK